VKLGFLRPLCQYDKEVNPQYVLVDELESFNAHVVRISQVRNFNSNRQLLIESSYLNTMLDNIAVFIRTLKQWQRRVSSSRVLPSNRIIIVLQEFQIIFTFIFM
jgi:hypothetical protein